MIGEQETIQSAFVEKHVQYLGEGGTITLTEEAANGGLERALIHEVRAGSVLFGLHKAGPIPSLIKENKQKGFHKKSDYALFTVVSDCPMVFIIEMKTTNFKQEEVICQLKTSACIVDYIRGFARRFLDIQNVDFQERCVVFCRTPVVMWTRPPFASSGKNTEPNRPKLLFDPDKKHYTIQDLIRGQQGFSK